MAYTGTTGASTAANAPILVAKGMGGSVQSAGVAPGSSTSAGGTGVWFYNSSNLTTDITAGAFFSDGYNLGMKVGDVVFGVQQSSVGSSLIVFLGAISSGSTAGFGFTTGSIMTSTFN